MVVFGAVFGCSGDAGFSGALLGVCSGVVGFNVAMVSCLVRENVRPAALCHRESAKKVRPARSNWPKFSVFALAGRVFSRRCRWRGCAGRASSRQLALRRSWMRCGALQGGCGWGVCAMRSPLAACRRRVGGLDGVIPPDWWRRGHESRGCGRIDCAIRRCRTGECESDLTAGPHYWHP